MTISIQELPTYHNNHRMFTVNFFGTPITAVVTSTPSVVRKWLHSTLYFNFRHNILNLVVGVGVQWHPPLYPGEPRPAATLQLCVGRRCLIFQLNHAEKVPELLRRFLTHPQNTLVGLWNHSDEAKLKSTVFKLEVGELLDMRHYAVSRRTGERLHLSSIKTIIEEYLGFGEVKLDMEISTSDWDNRDLTEEQIKHACVDAHASFLIGMNEMVRHGY